MSVTDELTPGVRVFQPISPTVQSKADRLIEEQRAAFIRLLGRNVLFAVLGDSMSVHDVVFHYDGNGDLIAHCSCPNFGLCSHIVAATVHGTLQLSRLTKETA